MTDSLRRAKEVEKALRQAVARALEKKRRLGQYAIIYQDGKVMRLLPDGSRVECEASTNAG